VVFPVEDGVLRERLINEVLAITLRDNTRARFLNVDGNYSVPELKPRQPAHRSQFEFIALAEAGREPAARTEPAGKSRFPRVRLAPSPFKAGKARK